MPLAPNLLDRIDTLLGDAPPTRSTEPPTSEPSQSARPSRQLPDDLLGRIDGLLEQAQPQVPLQPIQQPEALPAAVAAGQKRMRKRVFAGVKEKLLGFARKRLGKAWFPNIKTTLVGLGSDWVSPAARAFGQDEAADFINRFSDAYQQGAAERDKEGWVPPILKRGARGAARTIPSMIAAGSVAGPYGALGLAGIQEANRAITEGRDAGLEGEELAAYVASQGTIEFLVGAIFQKVGLGGAESLAAGKVAIKTGLANGFTRAAIKQTGKMTLQELPEEIITEIGHNVAGALSGVQPDATNPDQIAQTVADTTVQTLMTVGFMGAPHVAHGALADIQEKRRPTDAITIPKTGTPYGDVLKREGPGVGEKTRGPLPTEGRGAGVPPGGPGVEEGGVPEPEVEPPPPEGRAGGLTEKQQSIARFDINQLLTTGRLDTDTEMAVAEVTGTSGPMQAGYVIRDTSDSDLLIRVQEIIGPRHPEGSRVENPENYELRNGLWQRTTEEPVVEEETPTKHKLGEPEKIELPEAVPVEPKRRMDEKIPSEKPSEVPPAALEAEAIVELSEAERLAGEGVEAERAAETPVEALKRHRQEKGYPDRLIQPGQLGYKRADQKRWRQQMKEDETLHRKEAEAKAFEKKDRTAFTKAANAEERVVAQEEIKAGEVTPENVKYAEVRDMPPELATAFQQSAAMLIDQAKGETKVALQKIIDDVGKDRGAKVEEQKERIAKKFGGMMKPSVQERYAGGPPPINLALELFQYPPEVRQEMIDEALASGQRGEPNDLVERAIAHLTAAGIAPTKDQVVNLLNALRFGEPAVAEEVAPEGGPAVVPQPWTGEELPPTEQKVMLSGMDALPGTQPLPGMGDIDVPAEAVVPTKVPAAEPAGPHVGRKEGEEIIEAEAVELGKPAIEPVGITKPLSFRVGGGPMKSVAGFFRRFFTAPGELPQRVYDAKIKKEGEAAREMNKLRFLASDFRWAVRKALGRRELTQKDVEGLNAVLRGEAGIETVPEVLHEPLRALREHIDALSRQFIAEGVAQGKLIGIITEHYGVYATRSYRVFSDPKWRKHVPEHIRNRALAFLRADFPDKSDAQIHGLLESLLLKGVEAGTPFGLLKGAKLGSKDLSIFMRRKDIPEPIRELWGEYKDASVNYARSVFEMANLLANHRFLERVREAGMGQFLAEEPTVNEKGELIAKIAADESSVMFPLNGLYTTPEIKAAFERAYRSEALPNWLRIYMGINMTVKYSKTIASAMTHVRNFIANPLFSVANSHWRIGKAKTAWMATITGLTNRKGEQWRNYYLRASELMLVGEDVRAGELKDALRDASKVDIDEYLYNTEARQAKKLARLGQMGVRGMEALYRVEDSIWKLYGWENEKARYRKAHPEWSETQIEEHTASIVRDTFPTYSKIGEAVKAVRRFPFVGTFVSFPAEVIRTLFHTLEIGTKEMLDPRTRAIGASRYAGTAIALTGLAGLSKATMLLVGVSPDDDDDLRWFVAPWQENSRFLYLLRKAGGKFRFIDLGYSDPHAWVTDAFVAFMRGGSLQDSVARAAGEFARPFISDEILAKALWEVRANVTQTGGKVYNTEDTIPEQTKAIVAHLWKAFEPGTITSARRIYRGLRGEVSKTGRAYNPLVESIAVGSGQRIQDVDVEQSLSFRIRDFQKGIGEIQRILRRSITQRGTITGEQIATDRERMERLRKVRFAEMQQILGAAHRLGVPKTKITTMLREAGISEKVRNELLSGEYSSYRLSKETIERMWEAVPEQYEERMAGLGEDSALRMREIIGPKLKRVILLEGLPKRKIKGQEPKRRPGESLAHLAERKAEWKAFVPQSMEDYQKELAEYEAKRADEQLFIEQHLESPIVQEGIRKIVESGKLQGLINATQPGQGTRPNDLQAVVVFERETKRAHAKKMKKLIEQWPGQSKKSKRLGK